MGRTPLWLGLGWDFWGRGGGEDRRWLQDSADMPTSHARGLRGGRNVFSFQLSARLLQEHSTQRVSQPPGTSQNRSTEFPLDSLGWGRTGGLSPGISWGGQGLEQVGVQSQIQAQHRVPQSSLAGGPAPPAFVFTLGSSKMKDMARAQW